jgi:hypothetical protein
LHLTCCISCHPERRWSGATPQSRYPPKREAAASQHSPGNSGGPSTRPRGPRSG